VNARRRWIEPLPQDAAQQTALRVPGRIDHVPAWKQSIQPHFGSSRAGFFARRLCFLLLAHVQSDNLGHRIKWWRQIPTEKLAGWQSEMAWRASHFCIKPFGILLCFSVPSRGEGWYKRRL